MSWKIEFYSKQVEEDIYDFPPGIQAKLIDIMDMMVEFGPNLGKPYTDSLGSSLFEIRAKGLEGIGRCFFCYRIGQTVIFLHSFIKKTQKTPSKELRIAKKRMIELNMDRPTFENFKRRALKNPEVKREYEALLDTRDFRRQLIKIRKEAGLTLEEVAEKMCTSKSNLSRLESSDYLKKHSPKLSTIEHYASVCGKHLKLNFI